MDRIFEMGLEEIARAEMRTMSVRAISDADRDDMEQEARIGVWKAMNRIEVQGVVPDTTFAYLGMSARSAAIEFLRWRGRRVKREAPLEAVPGYETRGSIDDCREYLEIDRVAVLIQMAGLTDLERDTILAEADLSPESPAVRRLTPVQKRRARAEARRKIVGVLAVEQ